MSYSRRLLHHLKQNVQNKPLVRGMIMYSITWPVGSMVQQVFENEEINATRLLKFSLYGSCFVAPCLFGWMKFSCYLWPKTTIGSTIIKAYIEQISYAPFSISSFLFIMTILEGGSINDGIVEVEEKFFPTWKVSAVMWPILQSINYTFIPEKNRVPFIGLCSVIWTIFLTIVKYRQRENQE